jgi:hypothetical protein
MGPRLRVRLTLAAALAGCLAATDLHAQYFGRNKVHYDEMDFRVLATRHFDVHYAQEDARAAAIVARLAERWYDRLSRVLDHQLARRQPLVIYGSHRAFEQTNIVAGLVDESTGGFTESRRRRIALPVSASLAETDHVLGHEIVHAFQYDIAAVHRTGLALPLWFVEGMAEYLSLGPHDPLTAMWMRDAGRGEKLPAIADLSSPRLFPYRYGAALWSYLAGRFGEDLLGKTLRTGRGAVKRLEQATGVDAAQLSADWHASLRRPSRTEGHEDGTAERFESRPLISRERHGGRLNLGASLSPDGRRIVFLSERDQFSIDVFLADASTGEVARKLVTTATNAEYESLQYLRSTGSWDPSGRRFALATVRRGRGSLTLIDVETAAAREVRLPRFGEIFGPAWAPDGRSIAFSALAGGFTDLYVVELDTGSVQQLTDDPYTDLQPSWSPDGRTLAFVTDRFATDLEALRFGPCRIGLLDVASRTVQAAPALPDAQHIDPAWAADGRSVYVVSDPDGVSNVFRVDLRDGTFYKVTDVVTGVSGVTRLSPAVSVARQTGALAFTLFRAGGYEIHVIDAPRRLAGTRLPAASPGSPMEADSSHDHAATAAVEAAPAKSAASPARYRPSLSLEALGSPYFSAGGGAFGTHFRGGMSLLFRDLLGDRQLFTAVDVSSRLGDSSIAGLYVNRDSRVNWGMVAEQTPDIRLRRRQQTRADGAQHLLVREDERWRRTERRFSGFVAYPFNRAERLELSAGLRHFSFDREVSTRTFALPARTLVDRFRDARPAGRSLVTADLGLALVHDTAIFGAAGPVLGSRYRFQIAPTIGGLTYTDVLADYRRYVMPLKPYTLAVRLFHVGRFGGDASDPRLMEGFLGSPTLVRGYGAGAVRQSECPDRVSDCDALERLIGSRLLVAKVELRFPLLRPFSSRLDYGGLPIEGLLFADAGTAWGGRSDLAGGGFGHAAIRSAGAGVRVNAMGLVLEVDAVKPFDLRRDGWSVVFNVRPGF